MSLVRLRAIEHGVEENDLASVNGIGELLPLLAALKEGHTQVGQRRWERVPGRALPLCMAGVSCGRRGDLWVGYPITPSDSSDANPS